MSNSYDPGRGNPDVPDNYGQGAGEQYPPALNYPGGGQYDGGQGGYQQGYGQGYGQGGYQDSYQEAYRQAGFQQSGYQQGAVDPRVRETGTVIILAVVTFGLYLFFYYYFVFKELKEENGSGLGGGLAVVLMFFFSIALPFVHSSEINDTFRRRGWDCPVSVATGLWVLIPLIGWLIYLHKAQSVMNEYWRYTRRVS